MSELQKYWCDSNNLFQSELASLNTAVYDAEEVDARLAAAAARIELLQRAVEWCLQRGVWRCENGRVRSISNGDEEVPAELADIITAEARGDRK